MWIPFKAPTKDKMAKPNYSSYECKDKLDTISFLPKTTKQKNRIPLSSFQLFLSYCFPTSFNVSNEKSPF